MTLSEQIIRYALSAKAALTRNNVDGEGVVGVSSGYQKFSDADIVYCFDVTAAAASDVATLTLSSGAVAQTNGSPTITDAAADLEGKSLSTMVTLYGVLYQIHTINNNVVVAASIDAMADVPDTGDLTTILQLFPSGLTVGAGTVAFTFGDTGDAVRATFLGKSS